VHSRDEKDPPERPGNGAAVRAGDDEVSRFNEYRPLLFSIAYRMLGSVADAEDMLQEAFIRWQRASRADIQSARAFLVTIVSRLCINHLESARVRREEYVGHWLPEPLITRPDESPFSLTRIDESLSMAFLLVLERLTPIERAVFLLRDIFEYEYAEIARILGKDATHCRQILHRARQHVAELRTRFKASPQERDRLLAEFLQATSTGDLDQLVSLLSADAILHSDGGGKGPAVPNLVHGSSNVARALLGAIQRLVPRNLVNRMVDINGMPGVVSYRGGRPYAVLTLEIADGRVKTVYIISNTDKLAHLPALPSAPC
jgi:RNA polymerase sigma-70 factor, ECF subfamily